MNRTVHKLFLFLLIFSPLAFGTVEQWSLTVMETLSLTALCLLLIHNLRANDSRLYEIPGIMPLTIFFAYILFQLMPLPSSIIRLLSPGAHEVYSNTVWIVDPTKWVSISLNRKATLLEFFRLLSYAAFYVLAVQLMTKKELFQKAVSLLGVFASLLALFAIIQHFSFNERIYWLRELTQGGTPFGPYVNRNHYAGLMEMIFPLMLSLFIFYKPDLQSGSLRERFLEMFSRKKSNIRALLLLAVLMISVSIFLSLSRGGIISLSISMIFFGIMIITRIQERKKGLAVVLVFIVILYAIGWFGWDAIFDRFERIRNAQGDISEMRLGIWKDSMNIVKDFTITGSGFGSFLSVYPKYRTIPGGSVADHAHNDYLEFFTDGGLLGVVLFGWFLISVFLNAFATFRKRRDRYAVYMVIGAVTGIAAILIHSITDFNLRIGANGLYFFFLLGLIVSAANTRFSVALRDPHLKKLALDSSRLTLYTVATVVLLLLSVVYNVGTLLGNYYHSSIDRSRLEPGSSVSEIVKFRDLSRKASAYAPMEGRYRFTYADAEWLLNNKSGALAGYIKAVRLDPLKGEYIQKLGLVMSEGEKHDRADVLLKFGTTVDRQNLHRYQIYGSWQIKEGKREDGIKNIAKALAIEPGKTKDYITLLVLHGLSDKEIQSALPDLVQPHMKFAKYLEKTGNHEMAIEEYRKVLLLDPNNGRAKRMLEKLQ